MVFLSQVVCPAAGACLVAGGYSDTSASGQSLIETESGQSWTPTEVAKLPDAKFGGPQLTGLACGAAGSCVSVGTYVTTAGATTFNAEIATLSGGTWTATVAPLPADEVPGPDNNLQKVACPTSGFCVAVGTYNNSSAPVNIEGLIDVLSGGTWTAMTAPLPANASAQPQAVLTDVACTGDGSYCAAAGSYSDTTGNVDPLLDVLSGGIWSNQTASLPANANGTMAFPTLFTIACPAAGACVSGGEYNVSSTIQHPLIEQQSGTSWTPIDAAMPGNAAASNQFASINKVACAAAGSCTAAGQYTVSSGDTEVLLDTLSGGTWSNTVVTLPSDATPTSGMQFGTLYDVVCPTGSSCTGVGTYDTSTGGTPLVAAESGGSWTTGSGPLPAGASSSASNAGLSALALSGGSGGFVAVGHYADTGGNQQGLIEMPQPVMPPPTGGLYTPVSPFRILDTRAGSQVNCPGGCTLGPGGTHTVQISGVGGVPSNATAAVINLTGIQPTAGTYLSVAPSGSSTIASSSSLNLTPGAIQANLVTVALSTSGAVDLYNAQGNTNAAMDVQGYFTPFGGTGPPPAGTAGAFHAAPPTRVCDTRGSATSVCPVGALAAGHSEAVSVGGPVPSGGVAAAAVFNLTAVQPTSGTYLTASPPNPDGTCSTPTTSNLNINGGNILPNRVIVPVGTSGAATDIVCIYNAAGAVNFIIDVNGWFGTSSDMTAGALFFPVNPQRICDTRGGNSTPCAGHSIGAGQSLAVNGVGTVAGDPTSPVAIVVNTTGILPTTGTFVSLYPHAMQPSPLTSDLNLGSGQIIANLVIVSLSSGQLDVYNNVGTIDVALDAEGWFQ